MGEDLPDVISAQGRTGCIEEGGTCGKKIVGRGRCRPHYNRWWEKTRAQERPPALNLKSKTPEQRFWGKVDRRSPSDCWPWRGATDTFGHGQFFVSPERGKVPAHVYAIELTTGEPCPEGKEGFHHCDNPPCCNPTHIYYGTRQQNVADMHSRGRAQVGSQRTNARLTEANVLLMRQRFAAGEQLKDLAAVFGIGEGHVSKIVNGLMWKHVGGPTTTRGHLGRPATWRNN